ncbi:DUF3619 family protein [Chromobacterium sp. IIBBL 290-4]|uniref:DUF3619 family protein n=1 Tax=Chromobacterium sp. IIBBL 290-4 TaxID=2953890 RepID=UPI0020B7B81D|nr:DUF3619 family protein [Chromobacterium sp. IIBBL 290-4]UTH76284.1 DUF3619 family protein [Chromobacterium sp. IIBBL 290-4]
MKHPHDSQGDHLPSHITRILDTRNTDPTPTQQAKLRQARMAAMERFDERVQQPMRLKEKVSLWVQRHTLLLRRGGAALGFALATGAGMLLLEGFLLETDVVDAAVLSQDIPLNALLEPHFSRGMHD